MTARTPTRWVTLFVGWTIAFSTAIIHAQSDNKEPDPKATQKYAFAYGLQRNGLWERAAKRWQKFISEFSKDPRVPNAYHYLADCQLQLKNFDQAADIYQKLLREFPKFRSLDAAQFNLGLAYYNAGLQSKDSGDLRKAAKVFAELPNKFPKSNQAPRALYYQGECLYSAGDFEKAIKAYQRFADDHDDNKSTNRLAAEVLYALGTTQQKIGAYKQAAQTFDKYVDRFDKTQPDRANECRLRLGQSLFKLKEFDKAEKVFHRVSEVDDFPYADYALLQEAECCFAREDYEKAARTYERLPSQFPKSQQIPYAWLNAGQSWYRAEDYDRARNALQRAMKEKTAGAEAAYWLAQTYLRQEKPREALQTAETGIRNFPKSSFVPSLKFVRASAMFEDPEQRKGTIKLFGEFASKHPEHKLAANALYMASLAAYQSGEYATARQYAKSFIDSKSFSDHKLMPKVLFTLGESYLGGEKMDPQNARDYFHRIVEQHPKSSEGPKALLRLGYCLYAAKKNNESIDYLQKAVKAVDGDALKAEAYFLIGRNYGDAEKISEAISALEQALKVKSDWHRADEVWLPLALHLRSKKKLDQAVANLRRLVRERPKSPLRAQALFELGEIYFDQKNYNNALSSYREVTQDYPKSEYLPAAQYGVGMVHFGKEDYKSTVKAMSVLLDREPKGKMASKSRYVRGLAYQRLGQLPEAVEDLKKSLDTKTGKQRRSDTLYALGLCQSKLKSYEDAASTFATLLKEAPKYERADSAFYEMAFAYLEAKKPDQAMKTFEHLAKTFPKSPFAAESWYRIGEYREEQDDLDEAAEALQSGLEQVGEDEDLEEKLQYKLGWVFYQQGRKAAKDDPNRAKQFFAKASDILRQQVKDHKRGDLVEDGTYLAAEALFRAKDYKGAIDYYKESVKQNKKEYLAKSLYRVGTCATYTRDWKTAEEYYRRLGNDFPKFDFIQEARYGLGFALQNQGRLDDAKKAYAEATEGAATETAAKSRFMIGECAFKQKKYKEAIDHFLEATSYPYKEWQAQGYFEAAQCFLQLKTKEDTAKARKFLQIVVSKFPDHPLASGAKKLLGDLDT